MNTFFDLRGFLITVLKKFRLSIILMAICTIGGVLIRVIPLMQEYINFDEITAEELSSTDTDYPYLYQARRTLYIDPVYESIGGEIEDVSHNTISAYLACYQNKDILEPLLEKYFKEAAILANANQEAQAKYQFINGSAKTNFELTNFYQMIEIRSVNNRLISLYAKSPNSDFSETLVSDFEKLISEQVQKLVGDYSYTITEGQIGISLPEDRTGVVIKPTSGTTIREKPSTIFIAKRCIKGGIWGLGLGIMLSLLWGFFYFSVSQVIYEVEDLKEFNIPVLAILSEKANEKRKISLQNKLIAFLRGDKSAFCDYTKCSSVVQEMIRQNKTIDADTIAVTGSGNNSTIDKIAESLNETSQHVKFVPIDNIVYSADALKKLEDIKFVLFIEKLNDSSKAEIKRELESIRYLNKSAIGFIAVQ